ncbi:MAG: type I asparaginase [Bacteroidaceae bacterium]|nr:type I asparaginase [Bacteroidaceae bacterium]
MKNVLLIYTGGTIGMIQNPLTGALESFDFDQLLHHVPELRQLPVSIATRTFDPPIDSSDMDPSGWAKLVRIIADNYDAFDGFVILHGTDTMAFTASALSFMLEGLAKPVILTGSQLPIGMLRTDGKENLITSIEIAAATRPDGTPRVPEVCVFFHEKLMRGNRVTKSSADEFDAFESFNYPHLATAGVEITYNDDAILTHSPSPLTPNHSPKLTPHYALDTNLIIFSLFPGIRADIVREVLSSPTLKGVIFRTFGAGNAPQKPWLVEQLAEATRAGKVIVNITQCTGGSVAMRRYETGLQLLQAGVVSGRDSTVEAALTKLMFLFGQGLPSDEVRRQMSLSLAGEITLS